MEELAVAVRALLRRPTQSVVPVAMVVLVALVVQPRPEPPEMVVLVVLEALVVTQRVLCRVRPAAVAARVVQVVSAARPPVERMASTAKVVPAVPVVQPARTLI